MRIYNIKLVYAIRFSKAFHQSNQIVHRGQTAFNICIPSSLMLNVQSWDFWFESEEWTTKIQEEEDEVYTVNDE